MLLDVNVLLALAWPNHQFHEAARDWFADNAGAGWSTCAITQLGFIRISSHSSFTPHAKTPLEAATLLAVMTAHAAHHYLAELPPPVELDAWQYVAGPKQTTDMYLARVADHHDTKVATFDARMTANASIRPFVHVLPPLKGSAG